MTFKQGTSGNPSGRPKGTGYRQQLFNELVVPHQEALFGKSIELALAGNESMLRLFLERMLPAKPHDEPITLTLPEDLTSTTLLLSMGEYILQGIADQVITPTQGKIILSLVEEQRKLIKIKEDQNELMDLLSL